jgi:hypothetical protein
VLRPSVLSNTPDRPALVDGGVMLIDCDSCTVRGDACSGCVVTVLLGMPQHRVEWDDDERRALGVLAASGLVPPLRLVRAVDPPSRQAG